MQCIAEQLPQQIKEEKKQIESYIDKKQRMIKGSTLMYNRLAWYIHVHITTKKWFENFVLFNIVLIGVITGLDLEFPGNLLK